MYKIVGQVADESDGGTVAPVSRDFCASRLAGDCDPRGTRLGWAQRRGRSPRWGLLDGDAASREFCASGCVAGAWSEAAV